MNKNQYEIIFRSLECDPMPSIVKKSFKFAKIFPKTLYNLLLFRKSNIKTKLIWLSSSRFLVNADTQTARFSQSWAISEQNTLGSRRFGKFRYQLDLTLFVQVNFLEYLEVVYESIESRSSKCNMAISQGINSLEILLDDPPKWVELQGK